MAKRKDGFISISSIDKILRHAGATRVSEPAKKTLREELEKRGEEIGKKANQLAKHAGRKTIKSKDIKLASKG
ncbi:MAG: histone [Nanoarchaeota archaeon]|nr:histone [Nanoarchaeota archaeon]